MTKPKATTLEQTSIPGMEPEKVEKNDDDKVKGKKFGLIGNTGVTVEVTKDMILTINGEEIGETSVIRAALETTKLIHGFPFTGRVPLAMLYPKK